MELFDIAGNTVLKNEFPALNDIVVDVSDLPDGLYIVRVQVGESVEYRKLLVIH